MFVAKYPEWIAGVTFRDGSRAVFDGAKDLFKFWLDPGRFLPARRREDVVSLSVTDYYSLARIDAREALFVVGSDVLGPMGRELVPFASREAAQEFQRDHGGTSILRFEQVTAELVRGLDR
jgi:nitrous oxide reductase accessory protein NosL